LDAYTALVSQLSVPSAYSNGSYMLLMLKIKCIWKLKFVKYAVCIYHYELPLFLSSILLRCYL